MEPLPDSSNPQADEYGGQGSQQASRPPSTVGKASSWTDSLAGSEKSTDQPVTLPITNQNSASTFSAPSSLPKHSASAVSMAELFKKSLRNELSSHKAAPRRRFKTESAYSVLQDPVRLQSLIDSIILPLGEELQGAASISLLEHGKDGKLLLPSNVLQEINGLPCPRHRINPEGVFKRGWDVTAVVLTYMLAIQIPMTIAYAEWVTTCSYDAFNSRTGDQSSDLLGMFFLALTDMFFIADIFLNFFTGVTLKHKEQIDYSLCSIGKHYLSSWFWLDAAACIPFDCLWLVLTGIDPQYNVARLPRLLRLFGINRRSRGGPFSWLLNIMERKGKWSYAVTELLSTVAHALLMAHFVACIMWFIVRLQRFPSGTWPVQLGIVSSSTGKQYLWSLFSAASVMIGLGYGAYPPVTWPEALVWLILIVITGLWWARINSLVFSILFASQSRSGQLSQAIDQLMKLFRHLGSVPEELKEKAVDSVRLRSQLLGGDAELIAQYLSNDIFQSVMEWSAIDFVRQVPVLSSDQKLLKLVCSLLTENVVLPGALVYRSEDPVDRMGFIRSGWVALNVAGHRIGYAGPGAFIGEAALLKLPSVTEASSFGATAEAVEWALKSLLTIEAVTELKLFVLDRAEFHEMIEKHFPVICEELTMAAKDRVDVFQNENVQHHICTTFDPTRAPLATLNSESYVSLSDRV